MQVIKGQHNNRIRIISKIAKTRKEIIMRSKKKDQSVVFSCATRIKTKEGTTALTQTTSQENPTVEIIYFERTGLNDLCPNKSFILNRGQSFRGREGKSLLVHACHFTLSLSLSLPDPLLLSLYFCYFNSFPFFSFFLSAYSCSVMVVL